MILEIDQLQFTYKSRRVLNDISFTVDKGEILAVLGPNGVGKTTLLKCINAILKKEKGDVHINGKSISHMGVTDIAKQISYVAQTNRASRMTAFDAVLMGRRPHIRWKVSKDDIKKVDAVFKRLNMTELALTYIDRMSGGELQKVAIARAFVQETDLFLLDEPTSSLDLKNQAEILSLVKRVVKGHHVSAVMTMHDINTALRYADKFLFLQNGRIFQVCDAAGMNADVIESVYGIAVEIINHNGYPVVVPHTISDAA